MCNRDFGGGTGRDTVSFSFLSLYKSGHISLNTTEIQCSPTGDRSIPKMCTSGEMFSRTWDRKIPPEHQCWDNIFSHWRQIYTQNLHVWGNVFSLLRQEYPPILTSGEMLSHPGG